MYIQFAPKRPMALLLLWLAGLLAGCQNNAPADNSASATTGTAAKTETAPAAKKNIVFFGNSLTAAYQLSPEQGYVALIQHKIDSLGLPYHCVNAGLSGETTADGANRVDWVIQQPLDIFVLELGGNDALRGIPIEESRKNLATIAQKVKTKYPDCTLVISGMLAPPNLGPVYTKAFKNMYPELATQTKATLIPFLLDRVGGHPELNLPDGIHPNVEGQKIVTETVWAVLQPLLGRN